MIFPSCLNLSPIKATVATGVQHREEQATLIHDHCMTPTVRLPTCGRLLAHCIDKVTAFREKEGIRICCFKIGVTAAPAIRFESYQTKGFTSMWLIATSDCVNLVHMLEAALISQFFRHVGCKNAEGTGGDGALNKQPPPKPPYYVYVTGGRADQRRWVG